MSVFVGGVCVLVSVAHRVDHGSRSDDVHVCVMCLVSPPVGLIGGGWMGREGESCVCGLGLAVWCVS